MTTETTANTAPSEPTPGAGELTSAEQAFLDSGGADTTALEEQISSETPPESEGDGTPSPLSGEGEQELAPNSDPDGDRGSVQADGDGGDVDDGELTIEIGDDGKARDVKSGRFVPHAALHKERTRRQETQTQLSDLQQKFDRADERLSVLNEIIGSEQEPKKGAEEPQVIDPEEDIFGAFKQQQDTIARLEKQITDGNAKRDQRDAANSTISSYRADAANYAKNEPDFGAAYTYLVNQRHTELAAMGVNDQNERARLISQEEQGLASQALSEGRSPSQQLHMIAKARGFVAKAPDPDPEEQKAAAAAAAATKIENIKKGQQQHVSLTDAGGAGGEGLTVEKLADMSEDEFIEVAARIGDSKMNKLLGG